MLTVYSSLASKIIQHLAIAAVYRAPYTVASCLLFVAQNFREIDKSFDDYRIRAEMSPISQISVESCRICPNWFHQSPNSLRLLRMAENDSVPVGYCQNNNIDSMPSTAYYRNWAFASDPWRSIHLPLSTSTYHIHSLLTTYFVVVFEKGGRRWWYQLVLCLCRHRDILWCVRFSPGFQSLSSNTTTEYCVDWSSMIARIVFRLIAQLVPTLHLAHNGFGTSTHHWETKSAIKFNNIRRLRQLAHIHLIHRLVLGQSIALTAAIAIPKSSETLNRCSMTMAKNSKNSISANAMDELIILLCNRNQET